MSLKIYLLRHGETDFNKNELEWGQDDQLDLNESGIIQSKILAKKLKMVQFNKLFSSNLKRALQTADEISKLSGIKIISDERLNEYEPGSVDPSSDKWKEKYDRMLRSGMSKYDIRPFGGENIWDLIKRVKSFLEDIQNENGVVGIMAHSGVNSVMINLSQGKEKDDFLKIKQDNTCINLLEFSNGKWKILTLNDSEHLDELLPKKELYLNQKELKELAKDYVLDKLVKVSTNIYLVGDIITGDFGAYNRPHRRYKGSTIEVYARLKAKFKVPSEWKLASLLKGVSKYELGSIKVDNRKHKINLTIMTDKLNIQQVKFEEIYKI